MTELPAPSWERLPHDPAGFFGLSGEFDLRDLKRSYNRLIRRFKPEKYPEEFQRIRTAYESLGAALRYDLPARGPAERPIPPDRASGHERQTPDETPPAPPVLVAPFERAEAAPEPLRDRLASKSASDLYAELQAQPAKTPQDYVALALLSDMVARDGPTRPEDPSFVDWLLNGIAGYPHDWGLTELLREFLGEDHAPGELARLLSQAVEVLPADRFQYATERAWDRLLRESPFAEFRECLQKCGAKLGSSAGHSQLVFYIHVLKLALWKAEADFLNEMRGAIEDHFHTLAPWAQEEAELVLALIDYRDRRAQFVALGPCCERIDRAIQDWCLLPETEGDQRVLDCQYLLSMRGPRLLDELPDHRADWSHVLLPWDRIVADVLDRQGEPELPDDPTTVRHAREFMIRILRRTQRTSRYYLGLGLVLGALALLLISAVTSGALAVRLCWKLFAEGRYLSAALDGVLATGTLLGGIVSAAIVFFVGKSKAALDYGAARRELMKLIRVAPLPISQLATVIEEREDEKYGDDDTIDHTRVIARAMRSDAAIDLFCQAQRSLCAADPESVVEAAIVPPIEEAHRPPNKPPQPQIL